MQSQEQQALTHHHRPQAASTFFLSSCYVASRQAVAAIQKLCCQLYVQLCSLATFFKVHSKLLRPCLFQGYNLALEEPALLKAFMLNAKLDQFLGLFLGIFHACTGSQQVLL